MDLRHDLARILKQQLSDDGVKVPDEWDDHHICVSYLEINQRFFNSNIPYKVVYSQELLRKIPNLTRAEQDAIKDIENSLTHCKPLTEYMSKLIRKTDMKKSDFLLKNWNIYHVHLEKLSLMKINYTMPNLLFFQPQGQVVHFIDVKPHPRGATWFDRDLLEIIYSNWPWLLQFLRDVKPQATIPDEKVHDCNKHMVAIIDFHGGALMPTTFGVATSGNSSKAVMETNRIFRKLRECEIYLKEHEEEIRTRIYTETGQNIIGALDYELNLENEFFVACEKSSNFRINLFA